MKAQPLDAETHTPTPWHDAKLIVRAVNSHAALVAALEQCLILIEKPTLWEVSGRAWHPDEVKREAKAALALARGNQSNP